MGNGDFELCSPAFGSFRTELRGRLNFSGYICSDGGALAFDYACPAGHDGHCCCNGSATVAAAMALGAGVDINSGTTFLRLGAALARGLVEERQLDAALERLFTQRIDLGMFDPPGMVPWASIGMAAVDGVDHRALARVAMGGTVIQTARYIIFHW